MGNPIDPPDPLRDGLKHRPLAALRALKPQVPPSAEAPAPAPEAAEVHERVSVRRERAGHGGKTVTWVEGPGLAGREPGELAREIARALGVGARVETSAGAWALVVQGDQTERLAAWLGTRGFRRVVRGN